MNENIKKLREWIDNPKTESNLKSELSYLLEKYEEDRSDKIIADEIDDRFYKDMEFGTGGLRGKIGAGTNRMNIHTVRRVSMAFSDYILKKSKIPSVVIAYDNRKYSDLFAIESARTFSAYNIKVWLFRNLTPTPMLSYAVRELKATGGVVITASHNPKEYNGYKIYDESGCQCLPQEANEVSAVMNEIDMFAGLPEENVSFSGDISDKIIEIVETDDLIEFVPDGINESYYKKVLEERSFSGNISNVNAVYTPLNGTGAIPVTTVLERGGIGCLNIVRNQKSPHPDFTTCPKPNPEENEALMEGLKLCSDLDKNGNPPDILLATDPDCDRVGIMVRDHGEYKKLDGNQVGILLFDYIIASMERKNLLPEKPVMITTVVSTPFAETIAAEKRAHLDKVLTGFKYIGDKLNKYEQKGESDRFIFGFEESCGYLFSSYARDKDAVSACLIIADMVGFYKSDNKTLIERMDELYKKYGYYGNSQLNLEKTGPEGSEEIEALMNNLRDTQVLAGFKQKCVQFLDYYALTKRTMGLFEGEESGCAMAVGTRPISGLPKENMLEFNFKNRSKVLIRPSGTEPKIKIYFSAVGETNAKVEKNMTEIQNEFIALLR